MRRIFLYIIALTCLGLAIAQKATVPGKKIPEQSRSAVDTTGETRFVPIDSLTLNTDSIVVRNDTAFFRYDSTLTVTDSILNIPDSISSDSTYRARRGNAIPADSSRTILSRINREKADLEFTVDFNAKDSLVMAGQNNA